MDGLRADDFRHWRGLQFRELLAIEDKCWKDKGWPYRQVVNSCSGNASNAVCRQRRRQLVHVL